MIWARRRHAARAVAPARDPDAVHDVGRLGRDGRLHREEDSVRWRPRFGGGFVKARAELGVTAFGLQVIQLPPDYDDYPEHDHAESGQEEVFVALGGSGWMDIEGERVELDSETFVRVAAEPSARSTRARGPADARDRRLPRRALQDRAISELDAPPSWRRGRVSQLRTCARMRCAEGSRAGVRSRSASQRPAGRAADVATDEPALMLSGSWLERDAS